MPRPSARLHPRIRPRAHALLRPSRRAAMAARLRRCPASRCATSPRHRARPAMPAPRSTAPEQPGLDLISRRPPKQKFANFEDYLAAHGGMTVPLPPEASDAADTPETAAPAEAAE